MAPKQKKDAALQQKRIKNCLARTSGLSAWDALVGGFRPGLTCVYGPGAATTLLVYRAAAAFAARDEWSSDLVAIGAGSRHARPAGFLGDSSATTTPMGYARLPELALTLSAFSGGVVLLDDVVTLSRHLGLARPSREVATQFERMIVEACSAGTSVIAIGGLDLAGRPMGGGLWHELSSASVRLRPESDTELGVFRATVHHNFASEADVVRSDVARGLIIDPSGVSLTETPSLTSGEPTSEF